MHSLEHEITLNYAETMHSFWEGFVEDIGVGKTYTQVKKETLQRIEISLGRQMENVRDVRI